MIPLGSAAPDTLVSAREAASRLGVKQATLYAYVARGLLRSEAGERGRARRYSARELDVFVERRKARRTPEALARTALFWGAPVVESSISFIDGVHLYYRGLDAVALAERAAFEPVAGLLWTGALGAAGEAWEAAEPPATFRRLLAQLPRGATPIASLLIAAPLVATLDDGRFDESPLQVIATAKRLILRLAGSLAHGKQVRAEGVAATLLCALGGRGAAHDEAIAAMNRALVLSAEHELNASTFAARVAASAGTEPYGVAAAALATLSGPKHGGMCERVEALVREVLTPALAPRALLARAARGDAIPGFGHMLYPGGDPRAPPLLALARVVRSRRAARSSELESLFAIAQAMKDHGRPPPTLDLGLVAIAMALNLPPGSAGAIFAVGRVAGWIAHALEQYAMNELIRPRARYTGPAPDPAERE